MPSSDLSNFQHVFRADIATAVRRPRINKRTRRPVSCVPCRSRKLKCDRIHPVCGGCERRKDPAACKWDLPPGAVFANPATLGATEDGGSGSGSGGSSAAGAVSSSSLIRPKPAPGPKSELQVRLQRLEEMVRSIPVATGRPLAPAVGPGVGGDSPPETVSPTTAVSSPAGAGYRTSGHPSTNGLEMRYVGSTQWAAMLEFIRELQAMEEANVEANDVDMSDDGPKPTSPDAWREEPDLLMDGTQPITIRQVMAALPTRQRIDQLLGDYFRAGYTHSLLIHIPQFRRQYEAFWQSPETTSLLWISLLFSILAMALQSEIIVRGCCEEALTQKKSFTKMAMQCLVAGDYAEPKPFAVEALICHVSSRMDERREPVSMLWPILCLTARLARRLGYHRDVIVTWTSVGGRQSITPFQAEMRRRAWSCIEELDFIFSLQLGMPSILQDQHGQCQSGPPSNLDDEDFDEDHNVLLPSRPEYTRTRALYCRYKFRLIRHIRRIVLHTLSDSTNDDEKMRLDGELNQIHKECPPDLRFSRLQEVGLGMGLVTFLHLMSLETTYLQAICILHRLSLTRRGRDPASQESSRRSCRLAALKMLNLHADMEMEVKRNGKMVEDVYHLQHLSTHEILLAAMVLWQDLKHSNDVAAEDRKIEMIALQATYATWSRRRASSKNAAHMAKVLGALVQMVPKSKSTRPSLSPMTSEGSIKPVPPHRTSNLRHLLEPMPEQSHIPQTRQTLTLSPGLARLGQLAADLSLESLGIPGNDQMSFEQESEVAKVLSTGDTDWSMLDSFILDQDATSTWEPYMQTLPRATSNSNNPLPKLSPYSHNVPILPTQQQHFSSERGNSVDHQRQGVESHPTFRVESPYATGSSSTSIPQISGPWNNRVGKDTAPPREQQQQSTAAPRPYGGFSVGDLMNP